MKGFTISQEEKFHSQPCIIELLPVDILFLFERFAISQEEKFTFPISRTLHLLKNSSCISLVVSLEKNPPFRCSTLEHPMHAKFPPSLTTELICYTLHQTLELKILIVAIQKYAIMLRKQLSPHKEITRKNPDYTKNTHHYKNWIVPERQAETHGHRQKIEHLEAMRTKARELLEKSQFKFAMQCMRLRIMEIFYFGRRSKEYTIPFALPTTFDNELEESLCKKMFEIQHEFEIHNNYPTTNLFLFHNRALCKRFESLDKEYGTYRYNGWMGNA